MAIETEKSVSQQATQAREFLLVVAPALAVIAAAFWLAFQFVEPAPPRHVVITTGSQTGGYYAFGQRYAELLKKSGIELEVRTSAGSVENLARLADRKSGVALALLQGGIGSEAAALGIISLGRVFLEPVWVFHRGTTPLTRLSSLAGKRISVGPEGSGTRALAETLLKANGVTSQNASLLPTSSQAGAQALQSGEADALFLVVAPEAPIIRRLLDAPGIRLASFDQAEAMTRVFPYLTKVTVPMGMIDLVGNVPGEDVTLVAAEAALVAHADLHPALIGLLVEAAQQIHRKAGKFQRFNDYPKAADPEFPLSEDAERVYSAGAPFLQRYLPFWLATFLERMAVMVLPIATILLPLVKIVPMIYDWRVRSRIFYWYGQLKKLEKQIAGDSAVARTPTHLREIQRIEDAVANIPVPLFYSVDFYDLKAAIDLVEQKLHARRAPARPGEVT